MADIWLIYRFDHARFLALSPALREAEDADALETLAETPATQQVVDALLDDEVSLPAARQLFVQAACCYGDPLVADHKFSRFVTALARTPGGEEAAELLTELLTGDRAREDWLCPPRSLLGFLTPEETSALYRVFHTHVKGGRVRGLSLRRRRGGLLSPLLSLLRQLFDREPSLNELLVPFGALLAEAVERYDGIAVVLDSE